MTNTEKARKLYQEFRKDYHFAGFNQSAFQQRVRRLAAHISSDKDWDAFMYLKFIETRAGMSLKFAKKNMTNGEDYIVHLNGRKFYGNYRQIQDEPFAPVCNKKDADAIALMPDDGSYKYSIWLTL